MPSAPPGQRRRLLVIHNPAAGAGRWRKRARLQACLDRLEQSGCAIEVRLTAGRGDAEAFARAGHAEAYDAVVAAGGDGTIGEVANGLPENAAPLGILPLGSANVLAAEIGLSPDPAAVAQTLLRGPVATIWPGCVNGRLFTMMAGIGFDAHVVAALSPGLKHRLGRAAYGIESLRRLADYGLPRYRLTIDGRDYDCASAVIAKGHFYGGRFVCAPHARLDDPCFEICLFRRGGRVGAARAVLALTLGLLPRLPEIELVRGSEVEIAGPEGEPVQADGDIAAILPARVTIGRRAIALIVPGGGALAAGMLERAAG